MIAYVLLRVFLILLLVAANAFFAAAEFSLVSVRDTRIQQLIDVPAHRRPHRPEAAPQPGRSRQRRPAGRHHRQPDPGLDRRTHARPHDGGHPVQDASPRRGLRPRHCHCHRLRPDHLPARDPGRTGSQVSGPAARRAGRARRRRADGRLPHPDPPVAFRHEPVGGLGAAAVWLAPHPGRGRCTRPTNSSSS